MGLLKAIATNGHSTCEATIETIESDIKGIVLFDKLGNITKVYNTKTCFQTYIEIEESDKKLLPFESVVKKEKKYYWLPEMPRIIQFNDAGVKSCAYQQYDHEIAAFVGLFNLTLLKAHQRLEDKGKGPIYNNIQETFNLPTLKDEHCFFRKTNEIALKDCYTELPPLLSSTVVKAICLRESRLGTAKVKDDIMQVNNNGDWALEKKRIGLEYGVTPNSSKSLNFAVLWLFLKGLKTKRYYTGGLTENKKHIDYSNINDIIDANQFGKLSKKEQWNYKELYIITWDGYREIGEKKYGWGTAVFRYNASNQANDYAKTVLAEWTDNSKEPTLTDYYRDGTNYIKYKK